MTPDRRLTLRSETAAALGLEGAITADRYVEPTPMRVAAAAAPLRRQPEDGAEQESLLLLGERFEVLEQRDGYALGQATRDGYVGWVRSEALARWTTAPTHWVRVLRTYGFVRPNIKSPPVGLYSLNALVTVEAVEGKFARTAEAGFITADHLAPIGLGYGIDPAAVAETFLGAPYLWGGRESLGLDCSALVQNALMACGQACPRDTDMQAGLGEAVDPAELQRGDLVFWKGHVAMMLDGQRMIHANAFHMAVAIEPLAEAIRRIDAAGSGPPTAYRRP
jgi:hypothetical protein